MRAQQGRSRVGSWWWGAATTVALVGCTSALFTTPPSALVATVVVFAGLALLVTTGVETARSDPRQAPLTAVDWRRLGDQTATATVGAVAVVGLLQVSPGLAALVVACLALSAPWALSARHDAAAGSAVRGRTDAGVPEVAAGPSPVRGTAVPPGGSLEEPGPPPDVTTLSTTELVLAWRRSYADLARARSVTEVHRVATRRRHLLDELERRDGNGVERWLRSGARAASDPSRFLQRPAGPSPA